MLSNRLSISSWSLHRCLGPLRWTFWNEETSTQAMTVEDQPCEFELIELPKIAADRGLTDLELCHIHFPSRDTSYLTQLRHTFEDTGVRFHTLLVDYGDISSPNPIRRESDIKYLKGWIETAQITGASAVRIVAGEQPAGDKASIARSIEALKELRDYAEGKNVAIVTENFRSLTSTVNSWSSIVTGDPNSFQTIVDFGNLAAHEKEEGIRYGAPLAHSIHAKPEYSAEGEVNEEAFCRLLAILAETPSTAPISIIYDREGNMWAGIERIQNIIKRFDQ
ncbi:sugar phosphate isomerase/epimerase family protein [Paenibacillus sp. FA6]|uniref:sugar phosphate isomerase/epimerase family protein n=1 Tax=Paenibacillus sp. FA6 TaxID=3413029 RepID=UPI003F657434